MRSEDFARLGLTEFGKAERRDKRFLDGEVEWYGMARRNSDGATAYVVYRFSAAEMEADEWPWDKRHVVRVELWDGTIIA